MDWTIKTEIKNGVAKTEFSGFDEDGNKAYGNGIEISIDAYGDFKEGLAVHQKTVRDMISLKEQANHQS